MIVRSIFAPGIFKTVPADRLLIDKDGKVRPDVGDRKMPKWARP